MSPSHRYQKPPRGPLQTPDAGPPSRARLPVLLIPAAVLWLSTAAAPAQPAGPPSPADRTLLEALARARARASLCEQVARLPLEAGLTVGAWAMRDAARDRELRRWVRARPRHGEARVYSDGSCDVDIRLEPGELSRQLVVLVQRSPSQPGAELTPADIMTASRGWPILWGTGTATRGETTGVGKPAGWEDVSLEGIELARHAAVADAIHALLEQAGRLKVTPAHRLREFFESDDGVLQAVYEAVSDAATTVLESAPEQVAVAQVRIGMTELIHILAVVHQARYRGTVFRAPDFQQMALNTRQSELRAEGRAIPPECCRLREPRELIVPDRPPWATQTLRVTGVCNPTEGESLPHQARVESARTDGIKTLRERVAALVVKEGVTVAELLAGQPELEDDVAIFLSGTRVAGRPRIEADGTLKVRVELPLERLWEIVRRGTRPVEVDPSAESVEITQPEREGTP